VQGLVVVKEPEASAQKLARSHSDSLQIEEAEMETVCADNFDRIRLGGIWKGHTAFL